MEWKTALTEAAEKIMIQGGRLEFVVYKRGQERIPVIHIYADNKIDCDKEVLID